MKQVIEIVDEEKDEKPEYGLSASALVQEGNDDVIDTPAQLPKKRGPGRPPKNGNTTSNTYTDIVTVDNKKNQQSLAKEYEKGYFDNAKMLYGAIAQTETIYSNIEEELDKYRNNRAYGGKNRALNISQFMSTQVGVVNTKIQAVKELNSIRNKINDLVMKKEQMLKDTGEDNADKNIMDAYYALVNAPRYGLPSFTQQLSPTTINTGTMLTGNQLPSSGIVTAGTKQATETNDKQFEEYQNNLNPVQKRMIAQNDPNVKTVVCYDAGTGNKWFDVINVQTGLSIPGIQRPAEFLLDDMRIDTRNAIAVNSNTNMSFPLVILGTRAADEL